MNKILSVAVMAMMTSSALFASATQDDDLPSSSSALPRAEAPALEKSLRVETLRARDVAPLLDENATHLVAQCVSLNLFENYNGLLEYISKNKSLRSISFTGNSSFHEKKWLELHERISKNAAIKTVHFENVILNALINNSNPRVKKVLSRELLDALCEEYEEGGTRKRVDPLAPPTAPERARKRMRALQSSSPAQTQGLGQTALRAEHFLFSGERQMIFSPQVTVVLEHPAQASSTRFEARTAVTRVWDGTDEEEPSLDVHAAQSGSSMEPAAIAVGVLDTETCDDGDVAEQLLVLKHTGRTDFKKPRR